jgi:hypothetical protein
VESIAHINREAVGVYAHSLHHVGLEAAKAQNRYLPKDSAWRILEMHQVRNQALMQHL